MSDEHDDVEVEYKTKLATLNDLEVDSAVDYVLALLDVADINFGKSSEREPIADINYQSELDSLLQAVYSLPKGSARRRFIAQSYAKRFEASNDYSLHLDALYALLGSSEATVETFLGSWEDDKTALTHGNDGEGGGHAFRDPDSSGYDDSADADSEDAAFVKWKICNPWLENLLNSKSKVYDFGIEKDLQLCFDGWHKGKSSVDSKSSKVKGTGQIYNIDHYRS